jgi:hypothetical protein
MSHVPHQITDEFPEYQDKIRDLKQSDAHFARLLDDYDDVNRAIHRAETDIEPTDDTHMQDMRKRRMGLKDDIFARLRS